LLGERNCAGVSLTDRWAVGAAYEVYMARWSRCVAQPFVKWLGVEDHAAWLDVGCGTGALTAAICEFGKPVSVIACDPSGPFLDAASIAVPDKRVSFELAGGEHLPESAEGFDAVVSGLVLNFVPDPERALRVMRRRLCQGGVVGAYVWDYAGGVDFLRHFWEEAIALDSEAADLDESRRFTLCNTETLRSLFEAVGLVDVELKGLEVSTVFADFEDYWQPFLGRTGPAPSYLASVDGARRERLKERLERRLQPAPDGRIPLQARAWAVRGRDPA
jgi:SAM-dependent methyltransferase